MAILKHFEPGGLLNLITKYKVLEKQYKLDYQKQYSDNFYKTFMENLIRL